MKFQEVYKELNSGTYRPIYFLAGEEIYYTDILSNYIAESALSESQRDFNQSLFYAKDSDPQTILATAKQYPAFAEKRVVIVKEVQEWSKGANSIKNFEAFQSYIENPLESTVLVFCYMHKKLDKRTSIGKLIAKKTAYVESEKLKDYKVEDWISNYVKSKGFTVGRDASRLLFEHLGNDLSKIANELKKLEVNIEKGSEINTAIIEKHIGISKDYNVFELSKAVSAKDIGKAFKILKYFEKNPKAGNIVFIISIIYNFFSKLYILQNNRGIPNSDAAKLIKISPYFFKEFEVALKNYTATQTEFAIHLLNEYDAKSKGLGNASFKQDALLEEMFYRIFAGH